MSKESKLTQEELKRLLHYDPESGIFIWRKRKTCDFKHTKNPLRACNQWNSRYAGTEAGTKRADNYCGIVINYKRYLSHRLVFLYLDGYLPENIVDHIDGNPSNNRRKNLREVSNSCNMKNIKRYLRTTNDVKITGIYYHKDAKKWHVRVWSNGKCFSRGLFNDFDSAVMERYLAEREFGYHECLNQTLSKQYLKEKNLI